MYWTNLIFLQTKDILSGQMDWAFEIFETFEIFEIFKIFEIFEMFEMLSNAMAKQY